MPDGQPKYTHALNPEFQGIFDDKELQVIGLWCRSLVPPSVHDAFRPLGFSSSSYLYPHIVSIRDKIVDAFQKQGVDLSEKEVASLRASAGMFIAMCKAGILLQVENEQAA